MGRIGGNDFTITFFGVRGSTPCDGPEVERYGGNTSCVAARVPGQTPILLDLGTGSRYFGAAWPADEPFDGHCLLTHLHWDHVQGLPFFGPVLRSGSKLTLHAPVQDDGRELVDVFRDIWRPPAFPVGIDDLPSELAFVEHATDDFSIGDVAVRSRLVPHIGTTIGYRLEWNGRSVAYISDHQQPGVDVYTACDGVRALCTGVDLLIHDAQYTRADFECKAHWGHCTVDYAAWLAADCGVGTLALFHHDPSHDDDQLDRIGARLGEQYRGELEVVVAREGQTLVVGRAA